jgi:hypothetical protein
MLKITIAQLNPTLGDIDGNVAKMIAAARQAGTQGAELVVFTELGLTGYHLALGTTGDMTRTLKGLDVGKEYRVSVRYARDNRTAGTAPGTADLSIADLTQALSTSTAPMTASISSCVTIPGRRMRGGSVARVMTVLSTPTSHAPPSMTASILPSISAITSLALVGLGLPEIFALGAAIGLSEISMRSSADLLSGILTATVSRFPETTLEILSLFFIIIVSAAGQNFSAIILTFSGISLTSGAKSSSFAICTIRGLSLGRPFAMKILRTASSSNALAARP